MTDTKKRLEVSIELPEKAEARMNNNNLIIKGAKGEIEREFSNPTLKTEVSGKQIKITALKNSKREKKMIYTYQAHIKNMIKGATEGHKYLLKVCSSHFPMNVSLNNNVLTIKNFLGEKFPRTLTIKKGANVKVEGDSITIESSNKETAGTVASEIEQLTKRPNFDTRIFQDGIYITEKDGKVLK